MSLDDSNDSIEKLYGNEVLKHFPNYGVFWRQFIGNPNSEKPEPYEYTFPSNISVEEKKRILKNYEKIQITHYSLFCQLAGTHFQLKELENTLKNVKDPEKRYFRHWEHFEVGYLHLGSVFYLQKTLWDVIHNLIAENQQELETKLAQRLEDTKKYVKTLRDLVVHRGRAFTNFPHKGRFYIPLKVNREMVWSQFSIVKERTETSKQLKGDLIKVEKLMNELHTPIISEYRDFINKKNIQIEYG